MVCEKFQYVISMDIVGIMNTNKHNEKETKHNITKTFCLAQLFSPILKKTKSQRKRNEILNKGTIT
jgi:hypothetical protein